MKKRSIGNEAGWTRITCVIVLINSTQVPYADALIASNSRIAECVCGRKCLSNVPAPRHSGITRSAEYYDEQERRREPQRTEANLWKKRDNDLRGRRVESMGTGSYPIARFPYGLLIGLEVLRVWRMGTARRTKV
jgi:hypothetical protein